MIGYQFTNSDASLINRCADRFKLSLDDDWSWRQKKLFILRKFLDGSIYDNLLPFHSEYEAGMGKYVKLSDRRPSVIYNLPKIIVNESTGMLFGEQHFPIAQCKEKEEITEFLEFVTRDAKIRKKMLEAAKKGSVGSVAVVLKVLEGHFHLDVLRTQTLTPSFENLEPEKLIKLVDKKKIDGFSLKSYGYYIRKEDLDKMFYLVREWNESEEIYYEPYLCEKETENYSPSVDVERTTQHSMGFVPAIWIKNISEDEEIDGESTFEGILDVVVEISYQLSQLGRLFKYNSDPTLVVKNPSALEGSTLLKGIGILSLDEKGDAYYAEMNSSAPPQVMEYVKMLREYAIEVCRGNRSSPDKITGAQSGKAVKLLNGALVGLVGELRLTYGEALTQLYKMILDVCKSGKYEIYYENGTPSLSDEYQLVLDWPEFYPSSPEEDLQEAQTLTTYTTNGIMSTETAIKNIADDYNILDPSQELKAVEKQQDIEYNREIEVKRGALKNKSSGA